MTVDDARIVDDVVRRLGAKATPTTLLGGVVNRVRRVQGDGFDWVVRLPVERGHDDAYPREAWAMGAAQRAGIPVAEVVATGVEAGVPFLVARYVAEVGQVADPWRWLGAYARDLARIELDGAPTDLFTRFGPDLSEAWRAHLDYNLACLGPTDRLLVDAAYDAADQPVLARAIQALRDRPFTFGLAHGDLAPRNLVARGTDAPVLIDWGNVTTGPTPWTDVRQVFTWAVCHRTITWAEFDELARSAGLDDPDDVATLAAMTILQLLDVVRWAADRRPDLYDRYRDECRTGLARVLRLLASDANGRP